MQSHVNVLSDHAKSPTPLFHVARIGNILSDMSHLKDNMLNLTYAAFRSGEPLSAVFKKVDASSMELMAATASCEKTI